MENTHLARKKQHHIWALLLALALVFPWGSHVSAAAPSNDDFNTPQIFTTAPYTFTESTTDATRAPDDPVMPCIGASNGFHSVWFRFTPSTSGLFTVDTIGSSYDTVLNIWTGSRGSLVSMGCNDDGAGGGSLQSRLQISVNAGEIYYIEAVGLYVENFGSLTLHASWFGKTKPETGSTFQSINTTLSWSPSLDINYYDVCVDQAIDSDCDTSWTNVGTNTSFTLNGLNFGQDYSWQVRAHPNLSGVIDADSNTWWSFTTGFGKNSPSSGAVMQPLSLQLTWFPHPAATSYQFCIDDVLNTTCEGTWTSTSNLYANIGGLDIGHTYYWQVRAVPNNALVANNGTWWSFTTLVYKTYLPMLTR